MRMAREGIHMIPSHMQEGVLRYIEKGERPGGFLTAILQNDLMGSANRADERNARCLHNYAKFLFNYAPPACFGSTEKVEAWIERGGLNEDYL